MCQSAHELFTAAKQIRALMADMLTALDTLAKDESITTQQRHLIMKQVCNHFSTENSAIEKYAAEYLEDHVESCRTTSVQGITLVDMDNNGIDTLHIAGMVYDHKPTKKVDILNKDKSSWGELMKLLVDNNMADAVQQRLTPSKFEGVDLSKFNGLLNIKTDYSWSITKPTATKR